MKKTILTVFIVLAAVWANAARWQTITDNSHVYDLIEGEGEIYFSSWGGVMHLGSPPLPNDYPDPNGWLELKTWTTADGLVSNDVRNIEYISKSNSLWLGSAYNGVSIISPVGLQQLNTTLGLPSNNVRKILERGSEILVATAGGLASYYYLDGVNFPLLLHLYTNQNTSGGLLSNNIQAMELASNGYLFLSTELGLNFVHLDSLDVDSAWLSYPNLPFTVNSGSKISLNENKIAISAMTGVYVHSTDPWEPGWTVYNQANGVLNSSISSVCIDSLDRLWIAYGQWNEDFLTLTNDADTLLTCILPYGVTQQWAKFEAGLGDKCIYKIVSGGPSQDAVYLCTWGDGFYQGPPYRNDVKMPPPNYWRQFLPNSIGFPKVRNIAVDDNHAAWFSSGNLNTMPLRKSALGACRYLDGDWETFTVANSPIHTDNVYTVAVDSRNRKWFGTYDVNTTSPQGWSNGISVFDDALGSWKSIDRWGIRPWDETAQSWGPYIPGAGNLLGNTAVHIAKDPLGNMFVACFDDGFTVFDSNDNRIGDFRIPNSVSQRSIYSYHNGSQSFFGTFNDRGLVIWNDASIPTTNGAHWLIPDPPELSNCEVYGVVSLTSPYEGKQHWIAASNGLFMWDETRWYKWDTSVKRFRYNPNTGLWDNDLLYYVDEERLYGSVRTTPTAIVLDPFNRVWIGSLEHGVSMYNPETERFTNYFKDNSPLLSDYITALGYQPTEGLLLVGTPDGLNTLFIGRTIKPDTAMGSLKIFPNPFRLGSGESAQISNHPSDIMPRGTNNCRIYDSSGALVVILAENVFSRFAWDGKNAKGEACGSGVYFVIVTDDKGNRRTGKIALLR